ncbi:MAG TPA: zinc ribbon domain-containing protein [Ktedonobacteraceae bacterium]|jgi:ribosomal protein L40E|nr:zinc ribbon domain-containing protein [Ktedonobacteraceae bacterium]
MANVLTMLVLAEIPVEVVILVVILLALIVIVVSTWLFRTRLKYRQALMQERLMKRCPNCNALMAPDAQFCPHCGKQVPQVTTTTVTP